jgi:hypothetical protein
LKVDQIAFAKKLGRKHECPEMTAAAFPELAQEEELLAPERDQSRWRSNAHVET